jgi:hypothetical protein
MLISARKYALECHWNCCPRYNDIPRFDGEKASNGDRVFVNLDFLQNFLSEARKTANKFMIVCQNSDKEFNEYWFHILEPHAIHIYSINCVMQHPMVTTIPIGFIDWKLDFISKIDKTEVERTTEINASFTLKTNARIRQPCKDALLKNPNVSFIFTEPLEYYTSLLQSKYVICPEGEGHDTHRLYESIYCGAVPVLLRPSCLEHMYKDYPIKWVDSWDNLELDWTKDKQMVDEWNRNHPNWFSTSFHST